MTWAWTHHVISGEASRTLIQKPDFITSDKGIMLVWCAIGVAGEAGEVAEIVKKGVFHQQGIDRRSSFQIR